jgi:hypothetical protein
LGSPPPLQLQSNGPVGVRPFPLEECQKIVMGHKRDCQRGLRCHGQLLEPVRQWVLKNRCGIDVCDRPRGHCKEFHEIRIRVSLVKGCIPMRLVCAWPSPLSFLPIGREHPSPSVLILLLSFRGCCACHSFDCLSSFSCVHCSPYSHPCRFATLPFSLALLVLSSQFRVGITASG